MTKPESTYAVITWTREIRQNSIAIEEAEHEDRENERKLAPSMNPTYNLKYDTKLHLQPPVPHPSVA